MNKKVILTLIIIANIAIDQLSKMWAVDAFKGKPSIKYFNDFFRWTYAENDGAFLSLGGDLPGFLHTAVLIILPVVVLGWLIYFLFTNKDLDWWSKVAFAFILGGGISNIFDRILYGKVVDFMNMGIGSLRTGIFNVADMSIMAGLFTLIFLMIFSKKTEQETT